MTDAEPIPLAVEMGADGLGDNGSSSGPAPLAIPASGEASNPSPNPGSGEPSAPPTTSLDDRPSSPPSDSVGPSGSGSSPGQTTTFGPQRTTVSTAPSTAASSSSPSPPTTPTATTTGPGVTAGPPGGNLAQRLYRGWCRSGPPTGSAAPGPVVSVSPGQSIQSAIDGLSAGVVELRPGTHTITAPIRLRSDVVLRGADRSAIITTGNAMDQMVVLGGGFTGSRVATIADAAAFATSVTTSGGSLRPGLWLIGDSSAGQVVRVLSASGNRATLELPLTADFSGFPVAPQQDPITRAGLERLTLRPRHTVKDLIMLRSAVDSWVDGVATDGSNGQVRSSVYLRQVYRVGVYNSDLVTARELGDGGQGYGINLANNSSNVVIEGNRLRQLRHSILIHAGAAGNVVRGNHSEDPRHPNFVEGGPADISFHGYASANLVTGNSVERIQINDAGRPGPHNAIVGNTLRVGPLTLDGGVDQLTLLGNVMDGTVEQLRAKTMPSIVARSTAGNPSPERRYWRLGYDPFGRSGDSPRHRFGVGILDWGSGADVYVDPAVTSINACGL